MRIAAGHLLSLTLLALPMMGSAADSPSIPVVLGRSTVALNGPWKFHTGDDARWADPAFDDSAWESVDLSAPPDANDGDVGITPYTSGWNSKGHAGYQGYAWYRIHVTVTPPAGETLALLGPWAVDSTYQMYANGQLLGGVGSFSTATPTAYGYHYPRFFPFPAGMASGGSLVIAIRVWAGPWVGGPDAGGIHVAPVIGEQEAVTAQYRLQWLKIFEGYAVDVVPALSFFLMAVMVLCLWPFERWDKTYLWLAAALILSGIQRGNQAFFFWWQIETVQDFVIIIAAAVTSLSLGAWMMAWRSWFRLDSPAWLPKAVAALTLILMLALLLGRPWLFHAAYPHPMAMGLHYLIMWTRLAFLLVFVQIAYGSIRRQEREGWYALPGMLVIGMVIFSQELSFIHVPGIWFPYGVGLSLSEIMSVVFNVLLFVLLLRRLWMHARPIPVTTLESQA
ncbi:MAG TPA: glycoside hydrolase [Gammaproteobacteria bacterium]|nr:glycoside hydrolase [Gammaproteobacteria bacterium]